MRSLSIALAVGLAVTSIFPTASKAGSYAGWSGDLPLGSLTTWPDDTYAFYMTNLYWATWERVGAITEWIGSPPVYVEGPVAFPKSSKVWPTDFYPPKLPAGYTGYYLNRFSFDYITSYYLWLYDYYLDHTKADVDGDFSDYFRDTIIWRYDVDHGHWTNAAPISFPMWELTNLVVKSGAGVNLYRQVISVDESFYPDVPVVNGYERRESEWAFEAKLGYLVDPASTEYYEIVPFTIMTNKWYLPAVQCSDELHVDVELSRYEYTVAKELACKGYGFTKTLWSTTKDPNTHDYKVSSGNTWLLDANTGAFTNQTATLMVYTNVVDAVITIQHDWYKKVSGGTNVVLYPLFDNLTDTISKLNSWYFDGVDIHYYYPVSTNILLVPAQWFITSNTASGLSLLHTYSGSTNAARINEFTRDNALPLRIQRLPYDYAGGKTPSANGPAGYYRPGGVIRATSYKIDVVHRDGQRFYPCAGYWPADDTYKYIYADMEFIPPRSLDGWWNTEFDAAPYPLDYMTWDTLTNWPQATMTFTLPYPDASSFSTLSLNLDVRPMYVDANGALWASYFPHTIIKNPYTSAIFSSYGIPPFFELETYPLHAETLMGTPFWAVVADGEVIERYDDDFGLPCTGGYSDLTTRVVYSWNTAGSGKTAAITDIRRRTNNMIVTSYVWTADNVWYLGPTKTTVDRWYKAGLTTVDSVGKRITYPNGEYPEGTYSAILPSLSLNQTNLTVTGVCLAGSNMRTSLANSFTLYKWDTEMYGTQRYWRFNDGRSSIGEPVFDTLGDDSELTYYNPWAWITPQAIDGTYKVINYLRWTLGGGDWESLTYMWEKDNATWLLDPRSTHWSNTAWVLAIQTNLLDSTRVVNMGSWVRDTKVETRLNSWVEYDTTYGSPRFASTNRVYGSYVDPSLEIVHGKYVKTNSAPPKWVIYKHISVWEHNMPMAVEVAAKSWWEGGHDTIQTFWTAEPNDAYTFKGFPQYSFIDETPVDSFVEVEASIAENKVLSGSIFAPSPFYCGVGEWDIASKFTLGNVYTGACYVDTYVTSSTNVGNSFDTTLFESSPGMYYKAKTGIEFPFYLQGVGEVNSQFVEEGGVGKGFGSDNFSWGDPSYAPFVAAGTVPGNPYGLFDPPYDTHTILLGWRESGYTYSPTISVTSDPLTAVIPDLSDESIFKVSSSLYKPPLKTSATFEAGDIAPAEMVAVWDVHDTYFSGTRSTWYWTNDWWVVGGQTNLGYSKEYYLNGTQHQLEDLEDGNNAILKWKFIHRNYAVP